MKNRKWLLTLSKSDQYEVIKNWFYNNAKFVPDGIDFYNFFAWLEKKHKRGGSLHEYDRS